MKNLVIAFVLSMLVVPFAEAVSSGQDIATTIRLRGYSCPGSASNISERRDGQGNRIIQATCQNGKRYQIVVTPQGRLSVRPLN